MTLPSEAVDVLVWGGGTGGVAAAIQAARGGVKTLLLTPGNWLGGMVSAAGVCCPDGNELTPWQTGLWGAFLRALEQAEPDGLDQNWASCFGYRPDTAEAILQGWVSELPNLQWWPLCSLRAVRRQGARITAVQLEHKGETQWRACKVVVDGSDRGDLLPLAEAPFRLGWEAQELWGEPSAPSQQRLQTEAFFKQQPVQSPTWVVMGQLQSEVLPPTAHPPAIAAPFERASEAFGLERTINYGRLPGGLVMLNWPLHGNDWHQGLERAFSADTLEQAELAAEMQSYSLKFAGALEQASGGWLQLGYAFPAEAGSPAPWLAAMPYWREGRRLLGRSLVLEQHLLPLGSAESQGPLPFNESGKFESIAVGNYANDHHYPGSDWPLAPKSIRWGGRWSGTPFCIPYGALLSAEIDNLLAADKAFSSSHMANGATRLQPLILNIGQAAGAAAALAVQLDIPPVELTPLAVQQCLLHDQRAPAAVVPLWDTPWHASDWLTRQLQLLVNPDLLQANGQIEGQFQRSLFPSQGCPEPRESLWQGRVRPDGQGRYTFVSNIDLRSDYAKREWPLISLEPGLNRWLQNLDKPTQAKLIGCANPWGPWLRVSRLSSD
ncbi:MAG: FAD-dependent oxidoreductase [Cyanobacteria bacterium]|nr:FAD-dependent oxidoreductase [Cyanobacteriota bacterium]